MITNLHKGPGCNTAMIPNLNKTWCLCVDKVLHFSCCCLTLVHERPKTPHSPISVKYNFCYNPPPLYILVRLIKFTKKLKPNSLKFIGFASLLRGC